MLEMAMKYLGMMLCCFYVYVKSLSIEPQKRRWPICFFSSFGITMAVCLLRIDAPSLSIIGMMAGFVILVHFLYKTTFPLTVTASAVALSISYMAFTAATIVMAPLIYLLVALRDGEPISNYICFLCIGGLQFFLVTIPFRFKRLKRGMPFLYTHGTTDIGVLISIAVIFAVSFSGANRENDLVFIIPIFFVLLSGLLLLFWWRGRITRDYWEKAKQREIDGLEIELGRLAADNQKLAAMVHRDNKLIPAMVYAVDEFLRLPEGGRSVRGEALAAELTNLSQERSGILRDYEQRDKALPASGLVSIDALLGYMRQKAAQQHIDFDVALTGSLQPLVQELISESGLKTILADLIENAIIAMKESPCKNILVRIGTTDKGYMLTIFDSGAPFAINVLANAGLKRTTTHRAGGGSGIGLMSVFEIARRANASVIVDEEIEGLFSKSVSICFDNLGEYRIKTPRGEQIKAYTSRSDIRLI